MADPSSDPVDPTVDPNPEDVGVEAEDQAQDDAHNPIEVLLEMLERFETDHPDLVKAINDVSHYLSGMGI